MNMERKMYKIYVLVEQLVEVAADDLDEAYMIADEIAWDEGWTVHDMWYEDETSDLPAVESLRVAK